MHLKFIRCGMYGWCMEIFWTGLHSFLRHDPKLTAVSSLSMFPIYGMASVISPLSRMLKSCHVFIRGIIYMFGIFTIEYFSGMYLKKRGCCPWDYSHAPLHINGVIRLDYAPLWFLAGLFFEHVLTQNSDSGSSFS